MKRNSVFYIIYLAIMYIIVLIFGTLWGVVIFIFKLITFQLDWQEIGREAERRKAIKKRKKNLEMRKMQSTIKQYHFSGTIYVNNEQRKSSNA